MNKKNVLIIFGGESNEYEVSLRSACSILENIDRDQFNPLLLGITRDGRWLLSRDCAADIAADCWAQDAVPASLSPDKTVRGVRAFHPDGCKIHPVDVIFPAVHGQNCEDGALQGLLTLSGIPFVGSGVTSSALCFDKEYTHRIAESNGVPMAKWVCAYRGESVEQLDQRVRETMGYPAFVKPANSGSSVGTCPAKTPEQLAQALEIAFREDHKVLIEAHITAQEVECAVLGNENPIAPTTSEVISHEGFYDYSAKYLTNTARLLIPANISEKAQEEVRRLAVRVYRALGCRGLARVDFFVLPDQTVLLNEVNTLPGFTSISMYPKMLCASGYSYSQLITSLLELAAKEHKTT